MEGPEGQANPEAQERDSRERRLQTLRELAERAEPGTHSSHGPSRSPRSRPRQLKLFVLAGVLVAAALVVVLAHNIFLVPHSGPVSHGPLVLDPAKLQLTCIRDSAWSPDGKFVVALGYQSQCASDQPLSYVYEPGLLVIYSAMTGKPLTSMNVDDRITSTLHLQSPAIATPPAGSSRVDTSKQTIEYTRLLWSPNGKQVAIPFIVSIASNLHQSNAGQATWDVARISGLLLIGADGQTSQVFTHKLSAGEANSGRWDVATGTYLSAPSSAAQDAPLVLIPALGYSWDANGALMPQTPLPASNIPSGQLLGPIGIPDGGNAFTMWQPARITALSQGSTTVPGAYVFVSEFAAWSPDGAFLTEYVGIYGLLGDVQNVPPATLEQLDPPLPAIPVRDKGLAHVLSQIAASGDKSEYYLAWSHNGNLLAAETANVGVDGKPNPNTVTVTLFECATGKQLATFHPAPVNTTEDVSPTLLQWSPDDSHLLLYDGAIGALVLYDTHQMFLSA